MPGFVGREDALASLAGALRTAVDRPRQAGAAPAGLTLVAGEAGMGKTSLLRAFADRTAAAGARIAWGTCWNADRTPALWPWTQALRPLVSELSLRREATPPGIDVAITGTGDGFAADDGSESVARLRLFEGIARTVTAAAGDSPLVIILDDLQWADESSVDLLRFLAGHPALGRIILLAAYRPEDLAGGAGSAVRELAVAADVLTLDGLSPADVTALITPTLGERGAIAWSSLVHARSDGHPFFARELAHLLAAGGSQDAVPVAVRDAVDRRLARLSAGCVSLLRAASVVGSELDPQVLTEITGDQRGRVEARLREAAAAGVVSDVDGVIRFGHDLYRETLYASLDHEQRRRRHRAAALTLSLRREHGLPVFAAELARHFAAAVPLTGADPAVDWARLAADDDVARFAFADAADQLSRARLAVREAEVPLSDHETVELLSAEADLWLRAGRSEVARQLLEEALDRARTSEDPTDLATVALGLDRVGARFAMPRAPLVAVLEDARRRLAGSESAGEARVTAALARQLQHSVPADRPRAAPLAEQAVDIARRLDNPAVLAESLLAQHDALWTAGTAARRVAVASEMAALAVRSGDRERQAQGLLLTASAQLESGSAAFRATLAECGHLTAELREPRHDYVWRTRVAALALLDGNLDEGERLAAEAAELGREVGDTDTGNVHMSQRLEVVRGRGRAGELRGFADEAIAWWVGAPAHAHAVAAGFCARAGDLEAARRELDILLALDGLRTDRSYLWSVFVGEAAAAAIALRDRDLCRRLLGDLTPVADSCAVNGALVAFMGCHALRVGLLHAALGETELARRRLRQAHDTHRRLGARLWEAESAAALTALADSAGSLRKEGGIWLVTYQGETVHIRDVKGMHDLAVLLSRPGVDVPAVELADAADRTAGSRDPIADRTALSAYRRRLADLDAELSAADHDGDLAAVERVRHEKDVLVAELRRALRPDGTPRMLGSSAAERARKAVTARIRDAIARIGNELPAFGRHLDRSIRTGIACRYEP